MRIAIILQSIAISYATFGLIFGVCFSALGAGRIDPAARDAGVAFRILIFPGAAALWPVLLPKWLVVQP